MIIIMHCCLVLLSLASQLSLKQVSSIDLANKYHINTKDLDIVLSSSNNLLALYNATDIFILSTSYELKGHIIFNVTSLLFDINAQYMYLTDSYQLVKYDLNNHKMQPIVQFNKVNKINFIMYSPNYKLIYFINASSIYYYSPYLHTTNIFKLGNQTSCLIDRIFVDSSTQTIVASSFDCKICSFTIKHDSLQLKSKNKVTQCRLGQINFMRGYLALSQDTITTKYPQIVLMNIQSLKIISYVNQSSNSLSLHLLNINNYIMSYGKGDNFAFIYRNSIVNSPQQVNLSFSIVNSQFNTLNNQIYLLLISESSNTLKLSSFSLTFNCSSIESTNASEFEAACVCKNDMLFDPSSQSCKQLKCAGGSICECASKQSFNQFSLSCQLNCSLVYGSLSPVPFGSPNKCSCSIPYEWNSQLSDCSLLDCSLVSYSSSISIASSCTCKQGYVWNDTNLGCIASKRYDDLAGSQNISPVGLIMGIVFICVIVILSAVIFYYQKYKKGPQDQPKTYEYPPKDPYTHNPTPRPLSIESKTHNQLYQISPPQTQIKLNYR